MATTLKKWVNPKNGEVRVYINNREILGNLKAWFQPKEPNYFHIYEVKNVYGQVDEFQYEIDAEKAELALAELKNENIPYWNYATALSLAE